MITSRSPGWFTRSLFAARELTEELLNKQKGRITTDLSPRCLQSYSQTGVLTVEGRSCWGKKTLKKGTERTMSEAAFEQLVNLPVKCSQLWNHPPRGGLGQSMKGNKFKS